jgi:bifunctional non-homologous end joining protein LigD
VNRSLAVDEQIIRVGRHDVEITHPAKVLFPTDGITKGDLIGYYRRIAAWMIPHLQSRPLAMERYPDGIDQPSFFHKAVPSYFPDWIKRVTVKKAGGTITHVVCNNEATLVYLANQACITPHIWLSRIDKLRCPDQMVFDLDPSSETFEPVRATARAFGELLDNWNCLRTSRRPVRGDFTLPCRLIARRISTQFARSPGDWQRSW